VKVYVVGQFIERWQFQYAEWRQLFIYVYITWLAYYVNSIARVVYEGNDTVASIKSQLNSRWDREFNVSRCAEMPGCLSLHQLHVVISSHHRHCHLLSVADSRSFDTGWCYFYACHSSNQLCASSKEDSWRSGEHLIKRSVYYRNFWFSDNFHR